MASKKHAATPVEAAANSRAPLSAADLRAAHRRQATPEFVESDYFGGPVALRPLAAHVGIKLARHHRTLPRDEKGNIGEAELAAFYVTLLQNSICGGDGELLFLDDAGKAFLGELPVGTLVELGTAALKLNALLPDSAPPAAEKSDAEKKSD